MFIGHFYLFQEPPLPFIRCVIFLVSISLVSTLIFVISFHLLVFDLVFFLVLEELGKSLIIYLRSFGFFRQVSQCSPGLLVNNCAALSVLKFTIILPLTLKCRDCRHLSSHLMEMCNVVTFLVIVFTL
jgi:hypothetical protein